MKRPETSRIQDTKATRSAERAGVSRKPVPTSGRRIGYVRVSRDEQNLDLQLDAMRAAGVVEIREETASARRRDRPVLAALLAELSAGDVLVAWKIDRAFRSVRHALEVLEDLRARDVGFVATTQAIDTTTATGRFFVTVLAAVAELEVETIRERVNAGLDAARRRGVRIGRAPRVTPSKLTAAKRLLREPGASVPSVARTLGVGRSTLYRALSPENGAIAASRTRAKARR